MPTPCTALSTSNDPHVLRTLAPTGFEVMWLLQVLILWQETSSVPLICLCVDTPTACTSSNPLGYPCWCWGVGGTGSAMCPDVGPMRQASSWERVSFHSWDLLWQLRQQYNNCVALLGLHCHYYSHWHNDDWLSWQSTHVSITITITIIVISIITTIWHEY